MRRSEEKKPTNVAIKKEREEISGSISADKKNLEDLVKEIKGFDSVVKKQRETLALNEKEIAESIKLIGVKAAKITQLDKEIADKTNEADKITSELNKVKAMSDGMVEDAKKEIERITSEKSEERDKLISEVNALSEKVRVLTLDKEELEKGLSALEITISNARNNLAILEKQIQEKKEELEKLNLEGIETAKKTLADLSQNITDLKGKINEMEQTAADLQATIEKENKELEAVRAASKAMSDGLNKKEADLKAMSDGLNKKEADLAAKEKQITTLGNTLQKHLDKQNIPIKVFE